MLNGHPVEKWERKITEYHNDIQINIHKNLRKKLSMKRVAAKYGEKSEDAL